MLGFRVDDTGFEVVGFSSRRHSRSMVTMLCMCESAISSAGHTLATHSCRSWPRLTHTQTVTRKALCCLRRRQHQGEGGQQ